MSTFKIPKSLALCADALYKTRQDRLELQRKADELKANETTLTEYIIDNLPKSDAGGVQGKFCRVSIVQKVIPQVENWDEFYKYIKKTGQFDLMQRRVADAAIKERWEDGKQVPGVGTFNKLSLSVNKV